MLAQPTHPRSAAAPLAPATVRSSAPAPLSTSKPATSARGSIAWATDLPALPAAVVDLLALVADEDLDVDELCARLSVDMALTAKILRLANSSFYGARGPVTTVEAAVGRLGLRMVKGVVTAAAVSSAIKPPDCPGFDFAAFWREAVATAAAAQTLAFATDAEPSTAFTTGLLLRIGQLVLAGQAPDAFAETIARREELGGDARLVERQLLGIDHAAIGAKVAAHWRLPAEIVDALGQQEPPLESGRAPTLGQIAMAAGRTVRAAAEGIDPALAGPGLAAEAWTAAGVPAESWARTSADALRQAEAIGGALAGQGASG